MVKSISEVQQDVIDAINSFDSLEAKYAFLIDRAKELSAMPDTAMSDTLKNRVGTIKGCSNNVWIYLKRYRIQDTGEIYVRIWFDSDSLIVKGLIWIFATILDKQFLSDVRFFDTDVLEQVGLKQHLALSRANGLKKVLEYIKQNA